MSKKKQDQQAAAPITAFKAFDKDWKCRGYQFEIGKTFEQDDSAQLCSSGFHACTVPFDVWTYYKGSRNLARVSLERLAEGKKDDSKVAGAKITIEASINLPEWIKTQAAVVIGLCKAAKGAMAGEDKENAAATGDYGHAAATGYSGHAAATGNSGHAAATGNYGHAAATGYSGHAAATGNYGHAAATGDYGHAAATGNSGHAAATGYSGHAAATGNSGHAAATGNSGHAAATGNYGHAAAGERGVAAVLGFNGTASGAEGAVISLTWWDEQAKRPRIVVGYIGEDGLEAGIKYKLGKDHKFAKVED